MTATLEHEIVSKNEWLDARCELLTKEKELTRMSDELSRERQSMPWTRIEKNYVFEGPQGKVNLSQLFNGRSQLAVYHFMFGPDWNEGCPGCSYVMDHLDGTVEHLKARDVTLVAVSRGPLEKLEAFKRRMGWHFSWVSSGRCDFNQDFSVSFTKEQLATGEKTYNFGTTVPHGEENPGISFFYKDSAGDIFHTYSAYGRGLDTFLATYGVLDRAPKGRDEDSLPSPMSWVRHHDKYEPSAQGAASCCHKNESH